MPKVRPRGRSSEAPMGAISCPVQGCDVTRQRYADIQEHVRSAHSSVTLTQTQLDNIHGMYCDICSKVCSSYNNGARHKAMCRLERAQGSPRHERSSSHHHAPQQAHVRSRSRSPPPRSKAPSVMDGSVAPMHDVEFDAAASDGLAMADDELPQRPRELADPTLPEPPNARSTHAGVSGMAQPAAQPLPHVEGLQIVSEDHTMRVLEPAATAEGPQAIPRTPAPLPRPRQPGVSPVAPESRPAPFVPYKSQTRHAEVTGHLLQLCKDAAHRGSSVGFNEAFDVLLHLPGLVLTGGSGRSRARKVNARLQLLMEGRMEELALRAEEDTPPPGARPRKRTPPVDAAAQDRMQAQRARRQLQLGSIHRSARALTATGLVEASPAVVQQLRDKHPSAPPPVVPVPGPTAPPPLSVPADTFRQVLESRLPLGSAPGPSGWTNEMLRSALLNDDDAFEGALWLVNAQLAGTLPHCPNLVASRLVPISKLSAEELRHLPAEAVPDVRPIAIGEVWYRLAGICALAVLSDVGQSLQPLQMGVGVRGGAQIVGHAVRAGAQDQSTVTLQVDVRNAFNSVSRTAILQQVHERVPSLSHWAEFAYGTPSLLYVDGADPTSHPISSSNGVKQGDPLGPLLFALALHPVLEELSVLHEECSLVAYADDITLQGSQEGVQHVFRHMQEVLAPLGLAVHPAKCKAYCADESVAAETASNVGCLSDTLIVVAGTPIGSAERVQLLASEKVASTEACIDKLLSLPLSPQEQYLLLQGSLQRRDDHLLRVVDWELLRSPFQQLNSRLIAAVQSIAELGDGDLRPEQRKLLHLPHRKGGFAMQRFSQDTADAAFLSAAALADNAMAQGPEQFRPFSNAGAAGLRTAWARIQQEYPEVCPRELPPDVLVRHFLPGLQRTLSRALAEREFSSVLAAYSVAAESTIHSESQQGLRDCARLRSSACRPASAWLTTLPTAPSLRLQAEEFLTSFRLRLGVAVLHHDVSDTTVACFCHRRVANAHTDHSLVCKSVNRMITTRHNMIESTWRRILGRAGVASTRQPTVSDGNGPGESRRRAVYGDVLAMLPRRLTVADISVIHPCGDTVSRAAAATAGAAAQVRDGQKYQLYQATGSSVYRFVPLTHESYGRMGLPAHRFLNELAELASSTGAVSKAGFVESAIRELSIAVCRGNHRIVSAYASLNVRMTGSALIPGLPVPTADVGAMDAL